MSSNSTRQLSFKKLSFLEFGVISKMNIHSYLKDCYGILLFSKFRTLGEWIFFLFLNKNMLWQTIQQQMCKSRSTLLRQALNRLSKYKSKSVFSLSLLILENMLISHKNKLFMLTWIGHIMIIFNELRSF